MERCWYEEEQGVVFRLVPKGSALVERLEMLYFEGVAELDGEEYVLPYEQVALLTEEDAELLSLPEQNPYQMSITADGTVGFNDLRYNFQVLKPGGQAFVNPVLRGCILHINEDACYRLNADQYKLVCLIKESNQTIPNLGRSELSGYSLTNLGRIQRHAKSTEARLDNVISADNQRIIIPEKLDIEFVEDGNGKIQINPVILEEGTGEALESKDEKEFQNQFIKSSRVRNVYSVDNEEGGKIKYVCPPAIKEGLTKVKNINKKKLSAEEVERYTKQPRELFDDEVFKFRSQEGKKDDLGEKDTCGWENLPEEGNFISEEDAKKLNAIDAKQYSDRIKGITTFKRSVYFGSGHKSDWLGTEGESGVDDTELSPNIKPEEHEVEGEEKTARVFDEKNDIEPVDWGAAGEYHRNSAESDREGIDDVNVGKSEKTGPLVLDIKPNFDTADYSSNHKPRNGCMNENALRDGIKLYDYQEDAVDWMFRAWSKGYTGVLLADDMGLGKTLQTLAFISELKKGLGDKADKPILIVGPTALLRNWENEYHKFVADSIFSDIVSLHGSAIHAYQTGDMAPNGKKKLELRISPDVIALTTYETLRDYQFSFAEITWGIIVVDEAQKMKNPSTGVTTALKAMNYDYAICLSGTPVENSWTDLWSIMDFVEPLHLGTLQVFRDKYINGLKALEGDVKGIQNLGQELKNSLNPLFMRRMKQDKLEGIPKKIIHVCRNEMPPYQKKRYMAVLDEARAEVVHPLVTIAKLRDVSLHPDICSKQPSFFYKMEPEEVVEQSARLMQTFKILRQVEKQGDKALIFVVSKKMQMVLRHLIMQVFGIHVETPVNGEANGIRRQTIIDKFNNSEGFGVLILSPEAAGVGFTITSANHVIHLSRTWNPAKEDQATDRVYRIGQKKDVHVYIPLACIANEATFDDKLNELLEYKRQLSENVMFPTGDDPRDGKRVFDGCVWNGHKNDNRSDGYLTVEEIDGVNGDIFEQMVAALYDSIDGYHAIKTPHSNDKGADVVVLFDDGKNGLLLQCKHKSNPSSSPSNSGVQEIYSSVNYYKDLEEYKGIAFKPVVITNAHDFTAGAKDLAKRNDVGLITRDRLRTMLKEYPLVNTL